MILLMKTSYDTLKGFIEEIRFIVPYLSTMMPSEMDEKMQELFKVRREVLIIMTHMEEGGGIKLDEFLDFKVQVQDTLDGIRREYAN